jgi:hypothetical protein
MTYFYGKNKLLRGIVVPMKIEGEFFFGGSEIGGSPNRGHQEIGKTPVR